MKRLVLLLPLLAIGCAHLAQPETAPYGDNGAVVLLQPRARNTRASSGGSVTSAAVLAALAGQELNVQGITTNSTTGIDLVGSVSRITWDAAGRYIDNDEATGNLRLNSFGLELSGGDLVPGAGSPNTFQVTLSGGTATHTAPAGRFCVANDTTGKNPVQLSLSGTTLTVSGTGTDVINVWCP